MSSIAKFISVLPDLISLDKYVRFALEWHTVPSMDKCRLRMPKYSVSSCGLVGPIMAKFAPLLPIPNNFKKEC
jgi:hypothetical protein